MRDLRRRALESNKTVSRKALSRDVSRSSSRATSAQNSRQGSRNASRHPSDDEEGGAMSDEAMSTGSLDDALEPGEEDSQEVREADLRDQIAEVLDRKRSNMQSREDNMASLVRILSSHYVGEELEGRTDELLPALAKIIKSGSEEKETIYAIKAVALTAINLPHAGIYDAFQRVFRHVMVDSLYMSVKAEAIHALGTITYFGGTGEDDMLEQMEFLLEIVSSDGHHICAYDDAGCVIAAMEEYGFLASKIWSLEGESDGAIEIFSEQLDSSEEAVQIAAGENIALLYEKSYINPKECQYRYKTLEEILDLSVSDESDDDDEEDDFDPDDNSIDPTPNDDEDVVKNPKRKRDYEAYHNTHAILSKMDDIVHIKGRHISRRSKKNLHTNFTSIITSIKNPRRGPNYSTAIDPMTEHYYGSRRNVKITSPNSGGGEVRVDRWWKSARLAALRRVLRGGFAAHYFEGNRVVLDTVPVLLVGFDTKGGGYGQGVSGAKKKGLKSRGLRRGGGGGGNGWGGGRGGGGRLRALEGF
ncbi:hypothetical protein FQN54_004310 [Arachnomyces sp. PD_36]|nr:hypothetical protein FQN54_004310 [Arachnomyces sp. PD_36]